MAGQRIGYIRVSTLDQQTERQLEGVALDQTFTDKASGKDINRPQLELMLRFARRSDTVLVHSMDRLARNLDDLRRIGHLLTGKGVRIEFVKEQLTFTGEDSPMASLLLSVMGQGLRMKSVRRISLLAMGCSCWKAGDSLNRKDNYWAE